MSQSSGLPQRFAWVAVSYPGKRQFDVVVGGLMLVVLAPVLALIGLLVKCTSKGPAFYRGLRAGFLGEEFSQLKFRTMTLGSDGNRAFTAKADPRITPVGRVLRFFKLDELPQLINVLRGEMSIVGPRPEDIGIVDKLYSRDQLRVLSVRPGLTCLLQIRIFPDFSYHVPDGVDPQHFYVEKILPGRIEEDLDYVDRMSLWLDMKIVAQTAWCIGFRSWRILVNRFNAAGNSEKRGGMEDRG